tara:strand:+ start:1842 stop:2003 length:162 start_codon:yes stop_codon:yes gene_type:complete
MRMALLRAEDLQARGADQALHGLATGWAVAWQVTFGAGQQRLEGAALRTIKIV